MGQKLLASGSSNDTATLVAKLGQDWYFRFYNAMRKILGKGIKAGYKSGIIRISEKLEEMCAEEGIELKEAWGRMTDTLRLSIFL